MPENYSGELARSRLDSLARFILTPCRSRSPSGRSCRAGNDRENYGQFDDRGRAGTNARQLLIVAVDCAFRPPAGRIQVEIDNRKGRAYCRCIAISALISACCMETPSITSSSTMSLYSLYSMNIVAFSDLEYWPMVVCDVMASFSMHSV